MSKNNGKNNHYKRIITRNKDIRGGSPCIKGTRISVDDILRTFKNGYDINYIVNRVKACGIDKSDIKHVLDYVEAKSQ